MNNSHNNRINSDWQFRCAPLPAGYAERSAWRNDVKKHLCIIMLAFFANHANADRWIFPPEIHKQEYTFGEVRIELIRDPSESRGWPLYELYIFNKGELQAKYRNIAFENIYASEDNRFFAGLSNHGVPGTAFVVFDYKGRLLREVKHHYSSLEYILQSATIRRYWYNPEETKVDFIMRYGAGTMLTEMIVKRKDLPDIDLLTNKPMPQK